MAKKQPEKLSSLLRRHFEEQLVFQREAIARLERFSSPGSALEADLQLCKNTVYELENVLKALGKPSR